MNKDSTKVADLLEKDINKLCDDINCVILAHNKLVDEKEQLQERIDKAIDYIKENVDNTGWLEIGSNCVKELLELLGGKE